MGNFNGGGNRGGGFRGGNGGGRSSFGGGRGGDRGPVTMHKAVCDECHKSCEVPFRPSGDKPIYCNECFGGKKEVGDRGPRRDFGNDRPRREFDRPAPSFSKPVAPAGDDMKNYFREINVKLDRLTSAIEKLAQGKSEAKVSAKPVEAITPKVEVKKVLTPVSKKVEVKKAPIAKVAPKKVVVAKAPAKKVVAKKGKK